MPWAVGIFWWWGCSEMDHIHYSNSGYYHVFCKWHYLLSAVRRRNVCTLFLCGWRWRSMLLSVIETTCFKQKHFPGDWYLKYWAFPGGEEHVPCGSAMKVLVLLMFGWASLMWVPDAFGRFDMETGNLTICLILKEIFCLPEAKLEFTNTPANKCSN